MEDLAPQVTQPQIKVLVWLFAALSASLCWQLPTYDSTKSYQNLLVEVYGGQESNGTIGRTINSDSVIQFSSISFIRSGYYSYSSGGISVRDSNGYLWELEAVLTIAARILYFNSTYLYPQNTTYKGSGFPLRCLVPLENTKNSPKRAHLSIVAHFCIFVKIYMGSYEHKKHQNLVFLNRAQAAAER